MALKSKCEFPTFIFILFYFIPSTEQQNAKAKECPFAWEKHAGYCFKYNGTRVNQAIARDYCETFQKDYPYAMLPEPKNLTYRPFYVAMSDYLHAKGDLEGNQKYPVPTITNDLYIENSWMVWLGIASEDGAPQNLKLFSNGEKWEVYLGEPYKHYIMENEHKPLYVAYNQFNETEGMIDKRECRYGVTLITAWGNGIARCISAPNQRFNPIVCWMDPDWFKPCEAWSVSPCHGEATCIDNINAGWACYCPGNMIVKYDVGRKSGMCVPPDTSIEQDENKTETDANRREGSRAADFTVLYIVLGLFFFVCLIALVGFLYKKLRENHEKKENNQDDEEVGIKASSAAEASAAEASSRQ